jgi:hypothetical protein
VGTAELLFLSELRHLILSPHPSREGRGLFPDGRVWLVANGGGQGGGGGGRIGEDERNLTVMGLM